MNTRTYCTRVIYEAGALIACYRTITFKNGMPAKVSSETRVVIG